MKNPKQPLIAKSNGSVLSITVGVDTLIDAITIGRRYGLSGVKVADREDFMEELVRRLTSETGDGDQPVYDMLDGIATSMLEDGESCVEETE